MKTNSRWFLYVAGVLVVMALSVLLSWKTTVASITDQNYIFDTFKKTNSIWLYSEKLGSQAASDKERARVAISGPLALSSKEALYFVALVDNNGDRLNSSCDYEVTGNAYDSRWWSITLYDSATQHYVKNRINRSSWNSVNIPKLVDGGWKILVASEPSTKTELAWLPSQENPEQAFELMMRFYNPSQSLRNAVPNIDLPRIERVAC